MMIDVYFVILPPFLLWLDIPKMNILQRMNRL